MTKGDLFRDTVWRDGEKLCEAEEKDALENPRIGARVERAGYGAKDLRILWRFDRAEEW